MEAAVAASVIYYIVASELSYHEKIRNLTKDLQKERKLRAKDAGIWRALRVAYESELSELCTAK